MDFYELRCNAGLFNSDVAKLFGVSESTVRRWNQSGAPYYVYERISMIAGHHPDWHGVKILSGKLVTSNGDVLTKNDIEVYRYRESLLNSALDFSTQLRLRLTEINHVAYSSNDQFTHNFYEEIAKL